MITINGKRYRVNAEIWKNRLGWALICVAMWLPFHVILMAWLAK